MAGKMHVAVVEHFGKPLVSQEWEIPTPGPGQILVKTEACAFATRPSRRDRRLAVEAKLPFIPGHEAIGRVVASGRCQDCQEAIGSASVALLGLRTLRALPVGLGTVCAERSSAAIPERWLAEYLIAIRNTLRISKWTRPEARRALICAGITTYKDQGDQARPGEWIVISGAGGLGTSGFNMPR